MFFTFSNNFLCNLLKKIALKFILLSGIFMGASLASKWNVAYTLLPILIYDVILRKFKIGHYKHIIILWLSILMTYVGSYFLLILSSGVVSFLTLQYEMLMYHAGRHEVTILTALNGFMMLVGKIAFWPYFGSITLVTSNYSIITAYGPGIHNVSVLNTSISYIASLQGIEIQFKPWFSTPLMPLTLPLIFYLPFKFKKLRVEYIVTYLGLLGSFITVFYGDIDWYYYTLLPFLYLNLGLVLSRKKLLLTLIIVVIYFIAILYLNLVGKYLSIIIPVK